MVDCHISSSFRNSLSKSRHYSFSKSSHSLVSSHPPPVKLSPANAEAAQLYRDNNKEYVKRVRATVEMSWVDDSEGI